MLMHHLRSSGDTIQALKCVIGPAAWVIQISPKIVSHGRDHWTIVFGTQQDELLVHVKDGTSVETRLPIGFTFFRGRFWRPGWFQNPLKKLS